MESVGFFFRLRLSKNAAKARLKQALALSSFEQCD
jgi:hypothetical protein